MFTIQELEIIKAFIKRASMVGDEAFEYAKICNRIQAEIEQSIKNTTKPKGEKDV